MGAYLPGLAGFIGFLAGFIGFLPYISFSVKENPPDFWPRGFEGLKERAEEEAHYSTDDSTPFCAFFATYPQIFFRPNCTVNCRLSNLPDFIRLASDPEIIPGGISSWAFRVLKVTGSVAALMASKILVVCFIALSFKRTVSPLITIMSQTVTTSRFSSDIGYDCKGDGRVENQRFC